MDLLMRIAVVSKCAMTLVAAALVMLCDGCIKPAVRRTGSAPTPSELAQLWVDPQGSERNLFDGVGGRRRKPQPERRYEVLDRDTRGYSITYHVKDERGDEWNVKIGPEAQPEVVASRIVWALGYRQVPSYFVERWTAVEGGHTQMLGGARFRPRLKDIGLQSKGIWSWQRNPFVGTRPYNGLLALMMIINSSDLKNENNELYEAEGSAREEARLWYVVKDLGASLGETGKIDPRRNWWIGFEKHAFITAIDGNHVSFDYDGRHKELLTMITPADVRWAAERLSRLTDAQWHDAFRAGGFSPADQQRHVEKLKSKIRDGLALAGPA